MSETIRDGKFVELTYKVTDKKSGHVLTMVEFPLGYVHGHNEILAPFVHKELEGRFAGDVIDVPIDGNRIFETLTVDGNNPLCGRDVVFTLEILAVRDASDEEMKVGGGTGAEADVDPSLMRPV
jgi:FKBP-type peptidyl-prolyl cis-trans isomerase SlyD